MTTANHSCEEIREVKYDHVFDKQLEEVHEDFFRADEFISGTEWLLARDPTQGTHIHGDIWFIPLREIGDFPSVCIFYSFTDRIVTMRSILVNDSDSASTTDA